MSYGACISLYYSYISLDSRFSMSFSLYRKSIVIRSISTDSGSARTRILKPKRNHYLQIILEYYERPCCGMRNPSDRQRASGPSDSWLFAF